eukprot:TRINITY_DN8205_c0_g1_i1.p1 TRINITY_DN8205_c0_g1~~TRINITY_DN8205_c0_g1_i1.p1  ORF type:complete len:875 (+),score=237.32 TRINITY_DN8205_c0_g1_i1:166-2790(+)
MVRRWQKRFASAMPRRRAEPHAWEMVAKMVATSPAQLQMHDRYDRLQMMAVRMGWSEDRQRDMIDKEKTRDVIVGVLREKAEERAREAAERRRKEEEERVRRIEERRLQMEAERARREEERKLREQSDTTRRAAFRASAGDAAADAPSEEDLAAQREVDAAAKDAREKSREAYRQQIEDRKRAQREQEAAAREARAAQMPAPGGSKMATADDLEFEAEETASIPAPKAVKTTTILEKMKQLSDNDIFTQVRVEPEAPPPEVAPPEAVISSVTSTNESYDLDAESAPEILDEDSQALATSKSTPDMPGKHTRPRASDLPAIEQEGAVRKGTNEWDDLPGEPEGPGNTYMQWLLPGVWVSQKHLIKWVIQSKGFRGGGDCLADFVQRNFTLTDTQRAALIASMVERRQFLANEKRTTRPMPRPTFMAQRRELDSRQALLTPIRASFKKSPPASASLHQYFRLLDALELPKEAMQAWREHADVEKTATVYLAAINALLPEPQRTVDRNRPGARPTSTPLDSLEQAESIFMEFVQEYRSVVDELDLAQDGFDNKRAASAFSKSDKQFYQAASALILSWSRHQFYQKADAIWERVKRNANTKVRRMYIRRFTSDQSDMNPELGRENIVKARELLASIVPAERQEVDNRTILEAYRVHGDAQGAEEFVKTLPPAVSTVDRMRTMAVLLGIYARASKRAPDATPVERVERFKAAVMAVRARCDGAPGAAPSLDQKRGKEEIANATIKGLSSLYIPRPKHSLATDAAVEEWEKAAAANRDILAYADTLLEEAGFDPVAPDGEELGTDLKSKETTKVVTTLMYLYLTALDAKRAENLVQQVKPPLHHPSGARTPIDLYKNIIRQIERRKTLDAQTAPPIKIQL